MNGRLGEPILLQSCQYVNTQPTPLFELQHTREDLNMKLHTNIHAPREQHNTVIRASIASPKNLYQPIASKCISQVEKKELSGAPGGILDSTMLIREL